MSGRILALGGVKQRGETLQGVIWAVFKDLLGVYGTEGKLMETGFPGENICAQKSFQFS